MQAYTVLEVAREGEDEWLKVEMSDAYFKFKNSDGVIEAVLSDIGCD